MVDTRRRISDQPAPDEEPDRKHVDGVISSGFDDRRAGLADPQLCARSFLQLRESARVIVVSLRVEQNLDVPDIEAELGNARHDQRRGSWITAVDQDVTLGASNQE